MRDRGRVIREGREATGGSFEDRVHQAGGRHVIVRLSAWLLSCSLMLTGCATYLIKPGTERPLGAVVNKHETDPAKLPHIAG